MREPEPETIERARAGDLRAFESLVRDYQPVAWRLAYHLTGNRTIADDVTQEAFLRAFRGFRTYRAQSKFTNWLLRIVRNCSIDAYRRTKHEVMGLEPDAESLQSSRARSAGTSLSDERLRIAEAIKQLPLELREPFVTIEILGFNYQEASTILGVKVGTVKSRMHRARASLMRKLSEEASANEV